VRLFGLIETIESVFVLLNDFRFVFDTVFYAAESLLKVCSVFGPLSEELAKKKKYSVSSHFVTGKAIISLIFTGMPIVAQ
jgi:hypothetical protein